MNIIGTPPKPRAGATYTVIEEPMGRPSLPWRVRTPGGNLLPGYAQKHQAQRCADLLNEASQRTPEPDPAVCTYGELEPGERFAFAVTPECFCQRTDEGHVYGGYAVTGVDPKMPVRRVPASVVVHEEPGTHVRPDHRGHDVFVNGGPCSFDDLQHIVQQGAALLAQQDVAPESDMAPSACPECGSSEVDEFEPVDGSPSWACSNCGRTTHPGQRKPENDPLVQRLAKDPEALKRFNECKPELAEGRSKPAPFAGDDGLTPLPWAQGFLLSLAADLERLDERRADTLRRLAQSLRDRHDAQQAGEGGES